MAGRLVATALLVGLLARLAFGLAYWQGKPLTYDEQEYLAHAANLAAGRGFRRELAGMPTGPSVEVFARAPLYPLMLAGVFRLAGIPTDRLPDEVPGPVKIAQSLLGVLTVWVISRLAARAAGPTASGIAAWLAALYPPLVWSSAYALSEVACSPLLLASAWAAGGVIDRHADGARRSSGLLLASGILAGLGALVHPVALVFVAVTTAWLAWRRRWRLASIFALAAAVTIAPWTARNAVVHGRFIPVVAAGGITFWTGNHPLAMGEGDMAANPRIKEAHVAFRQGIAHLSPEQREPHYYRAALTYIAEHPTDVARLAVKKLFYTWVPIGPSYTLHSAPYYWATVLSYVPLLIVAVLALPALSRSPCPPRALALLVASSAFVCLVFFPQERFRIPIVDPSLCVAASAWLARRATGPRGER
jgi:4-amino-4-deoxy-L-arabinose transferase-like glycosyltransferase